MIRTPNHGPRERANFYADKWNGGTFGTFFQGSRKSENKVFS